MTRRRSPGGGRVLCREYVPSRHIRSSGRALSPRQVNSAALIWDMNRWPSGRVSASAYACMYGREFCSNTQWSTLFSVNHRGMLEGRNFSHDTWVTKAWTAIDRLSAIWKTDLTDKMKRSFFQAAVVSILLYGCTTWTLTKRMKKKLDGNYTRRLQAILNKSWSQHPTKQQLYGHLPPITKTIKVRQTRHAGHCWRSRDQLISDVLLWTPSHGRAKAGRPAGTYIQQLCVDTGCSPEE